MTQRIALRCPTCQKVSYRPVGFVMAKVHFVCNYCHDVGKIDRHRIMLALTRHRPVAEVEDGVLEPVSDWPAKKRDA